MEEDDDDDDDDIYLLIYFVACLAIQGKALSTYIPSPAISFVTTFHVVQSWRQ
jgi:hypothetical protein